MVRVHDIAFCFIAVVIVASLFGSYSDAAAGGRRHGSLIAAIASNRMDPAAWRNLAAALGETEVAKLDADLGSPTYARVTRVFCRVQALEGTMSALNTNSEPAAAALLVKQLADDWAALGTTIREAQTRVTSLPLQLPAEGLKVVSTAADGKQQWAFVTSAKDCFLKALAVVAGGAGSSETKKKTKDNSNSERKDTPLKAIRHAGAWRGLSLLFPRSSSSSGASSSKTIEIATDTVVTQTECLAYSLESPGGQTAETWLLLGTALKEQSLELKLREPDDAVRRGTNYSSKVVAAVLGVNYSARAALEESIQLDHTIGAAWFHLGEVLLHFSPSALRDINSEADFIKIATSDDFERQEELSVTLLNERMHAKRCFGLALRYNSGLGDAWHRLAETVPLETQADKAEYAAELKRREDLKEQRRAENELRRQKRLANRGSSSSSPPAATAGAKPPVAALAPEDDDEMFLEEDREQQAATAEEQESKREKKKEQGGASASSSSASDKDVNSGADIWEKAEEKIRAEEEENEDRLEDEYATRDRRRKLQFVAVMPSGAEQSKLACLQAAIDAVNPTRRLGAAWVQLSLAMREQKVEAVWISGAQLTAKDCLFAALRQQDQEELLRDGGGSSSWKQTAVARLDFTPPALQVLCDLWRAEGASAQEMWAGFGSAAMLCQRF